MLEAQWQMLLWQGIFGELTMRCVIVDGALQGQSSVSITRQIRTPKERWPWPS
jgi:hypothetical protein